MHYYSYVKSGQIGRGLGLGLLLLLFGMPAHAVTPQALEAGVPSLAPMLEDVTPAVVTITVSRSVDSGPGDFFNGRELPEQFRRFFDNFPEPGPGQRPEGFEGPQNRMMGAGSGVIVDAEQGYIITNHHVIAESDEINVYLTNDRQYTARLVGSDPNTDLALLQIEADEDELFALEYADIDHVQVGDYVVAIGNPFGIGQTVTSGIVSALGRAGLNAENYEDFIQTDAAINVGNSGGALVDLEGRLIGINTAIISRSGGGSNGIGFAVPVDMVQTVVRHLERDGEVRRGMLGVSISDLTPDVAQTLGLNITRGALVRSVLPGSAAEAAGIAVADVIVSVNGEPVNNSRELRNTIGLMTLGRNVELGLYRDGRRITLDATISNQQTETGGDNADGADGGQPQATPSMYRGARLQATPDNNGIAVVEVSPQSPAQIAGLEPGDVIIEVNRSPVSNLAEFNSAISDTDRVTALTVLREGRRLLVLMPRGG
ncbi:MAG: Do family serine endopeptidase [Pseudohongiellaceae bacterium]